MGCGVESVSSVEVHPPMRIVARAAGEGDSLIDRYDVFSPEVREREFDLGENVFGFRWLGAKRIVEGSIG